MVTLVVLTIWRQKMGNGYIKFHKGERENFGNLPANNSPNSPNSPMFYPTSVFLELYNTIVLCMHKQTLYCHILLCIATVQLKCNFTHVWWSTHGYMQIFACKIQKFSVEIFIFTRRGVARDVEYHETWSTTRHEIPRDMKFHETYHAYVHGD